MRELWCDQGNNTGAKESMYTESDTQMNRYGWPMAFSMRPSTQGPEFCSSPCSLVQGAEDQVRDVMTSIHRTHCKTSCMISELGSIKLGHPTEDFSFAL